MTSEMQNKVNPSLDDLDHTFISNMIFVKQAVFPVPGAPDMYKLPGFPLGR